MPSSGISRVNSQDRSLYWTDDIPVCHLSAVGMSNNQIYHENAPSRREEHECEDSSFRFRPEAEKEIYLYGVFDGHDGSKLSNFAAQRFPAELLLGQLNNKLDDNEEILNVLHQAFVSVDKAYLDSIADQLAEKCTLTDQLRVLQGKVEGFTQVEKALLYKKSLEKLEAIEREISGGTSAVIALIIKNKLYVASVGVCRALLCKTDENGVLRVHQLFVDHDLDNPEERKRLHNLGLDVEKIRMAGVIGNQPYTRTLGDYNIKIGYKDIELLCTASSDPVIAEPELSNAIELDDNCGFLILMSSGVYRSLEEIGEPNPNVTIASSIASEFAVQSTLSAVAQGVVDKIGRMHHDKFMAHVDGRPKDLCPKREDMTLLIRNFNYPMPNAMLNPSSAGTPVRPVAVPYFPDQPPPTLPLSVVIPTNTEVEGEDHRPQFTMESLHSTNTNTNNTHGSTQRSTTYTSSNDSTQSGEDSGRPITKTSTVVAELPLDEEGKIKAYVDFTGFYEELAKLSKEEHDRLEIELEPKPAYEPIVEEKEALSPTSPQSHNTYQTIPSST